jgi:lysophospholipase L1-like esterase
MTDIIVTQTNNEYVITPDAQYTSATIDAATLAGTSAGTTAANIAVAAATSKAINLWPDPLFARSGGDLDSTYKERRLYSNLRFAANWENDVDQGTGAGYWEAPSGGGLHGFNTPIASPAADLADIAIGQSIVGYFIVQAAAGTGIRISGRFNNAADGNAGGIVASNFIATGAVQVIKSPVSVIPAASVEAEHWCYNIGGTAGTINILSHGVAAEVSVDSVAAQDMSHINFAYSQKDVTAATSTISKMIDTISNVDFDTAGINNAVTTNSIVDRLATFTITGWGVTGPKPGAFTTANAVRIRRVNQTVAATAEIAKLLFVFRTHATAPETTGATQLVVGWANVPAARKDYFDVTMMLRDPLDTSVYKNLTLADMAARFGYMVYAYDAVGDLVSINEARGLTTGLPDTDKFLVTTQDPKTASWAGATGDGTGIGVEFLTLAKTAGSPSQDDDYPVPSEDFLNEIEAAIDANNANPEAINLSAMPAYRAKKVNTESGVGAWIGDSLTAVPVYGFRQFRALLDAEIGLSGPGYISANSEIAVPPLNAAGTVNATRTRTGVWGDVRFVGDKGFAEGGYGPDGAHASTTDVTASISFNSTLGVTKHILHYIQQPNGGTFTYALGGGATTEVNTNGALEYKTIIVIGTAALNIVITVAGAAGVIICGCDVRNHVAGKSVLHKLGNGGATASRFTDIPSAFYQTAITALELDWAEICLGANDCYQSVSPSAFTGHINTIVARTLAARPNCSLALIAPGPNDFVGPLSIDNYADELYNISADARIPFGNMKLSFGTYAAALARGVMNNDGVHPDLNGLGGQIIAQRRFDWLYK